MTRRVLARLAVGCGLLAATPWVLRAQDSLPPWAGGFTASLGQPTRTRVYTGGSFGIDWRRGYGSAPVSYLTFGLVRDLGNPVVSTVAASVEGYGGLRSARPDAGIRALLHIPMLRSVAGVDYNARDARFGAMVGFSTPMRRGGLFHDGTVLRWEWSSGPLSALRASVVIPVRQTAAGKTRPLRDRVDIPVRVERLTPSTGGSAELDSMLVVVRTAARQVFRLTVPPLEGTGADPRAALESLIGELRNPPPVLGERGAGLDVDGFIRTYHSALEHAFSIAASGRAGSGASPSQEGASIADSARRVLRQQLLYPYNRLLGQWKSKTTLAGLATHARGNFARSLVAGTALPAEREAAVHYVFEHLLATIQELETDALRRWTDSRLVWLPLQLGLRPEDHDTQSKLDAIVEGVVGARFTDGNQVGYVINGEFQQEVVRTILDAEDYHVLWVHDFRGYSGSGLPDTVTSRIVLDAYYRALIQRVQEYDTRARLPTYLIFIDQHYYELNRGRFWLDVLEDPLGRVPRLPPQLAEFDRSIRARQQELRRAIDASRLLQAETRQYGPDWLRNLVKVQVSVTNPADHSFWSRQVVPLLGIPDNIIRDHRKIAFYDISEEDPYKGLAIYTGMGVGEHYVGGTWEDRSIVVRGPAVQSLKAQARALLESQGLTGDRLPYVLRARPGPGYRRVAEPEIPRTREAGTRDQRAVELHNGTGFRDKQVTVAKAVLYNLMPPGSVILAPDPLWGSAVYAALLAGSAFRGCRVLFVAPSLGAAPAANWPSMGVAHELFARLIVLQQEFGRELEESGGMLKTGLYNPDVAVDATRDRLLLAYRNGRRTPFLRRLFPVHPDVDSLIVGLDRAQSGSDTLRPPVVVRPKLHLKATFLASRQGWDSLMSRPELAPLLQTFVAQLQSPGGDPRKRADTLAAMSKEVERAFRESRPVHEQERILYFLLIGSANQDYRSMLLDGEASMLLSGWSGIVALIDFSLITALSVWIDDLETLDALLPAPNGFRRGVARRLRFIL